MPEPVFKNVKFAFINILNVNTTHQLAIFYAVFNFDC